MAYCMHCKQEMKLAVSCTERVLRMGGARYPCVAYGNERGGEQPRWRCHDCGVQPGHFHHPGCDWAQCPRCGGQLFMCGCRFDEYGLNPEEAAGGDRSDARFA